MNLRDRGGVFETKNLASCGQRGPKVVCRSSDQAFWGPFGTHFGRLWGLKWRQKTRSVLDVLLGSKLGSKLMDFGTKFEPNEDDTLVEGLKRGKSIFEQQSMHFYRFLGFSSIHGSMLLEAKVYSKTKLEKGLNLRVILE